MKKLIGRKREYHSLLNLIKKQNNSALLIGLKGKRRTGKTYLVNYLAENYTEHNTIFLPFIGLEQESSRQNLKHSILTLKSLTKNTNYKANEWFEFFIHINDFCQNNKNKKIILFLDEICWFSKKDNFVNQFQSAWNTLLVHNENLVCFMAGSVTSWMDDNLFKNTKGFYNRIDLILEINPFSLKEIAIYLRSLDVNISENDIIQYYNIFGGIIKHYNQIDLSKTVFQNIESFLKDKNKYFEYERNILLDGLFSTKRKHKDIIDVLCKVKSSNVDNLNKALGTTGTILYKDLHELVENKILLTDDTNRNKTYSLCDNFIYFNYYWHNSNREFNQAAFDTWKGAAFEITILNQINLILEDDFQKTLNVKAQLDNGNGNQYKQIDILLTHSDQIRNLILEIKNYKEFITFSEKDCKELMDKLVFLNKPHTKMMIISVNGSKTYDNSIINLCLKDWLKE